MDAITLQTMFGTNSGPIEEWLRNLSFTWVRHGWELVKALSKGTGGTWQADGVLGALESMGYIKRLQKELGYAPEILAFGVGGSACLKDARYPCLYGWGTTDKLDDLFKCRDRSVPLHEALVQG